MKRTQNRADFQEATFRRLTVLPVEGKKPVDRYSSSVSSEEMQIKTTMSHLLTRLRTAILKRSSKLKCCRGRGEQGTLLCRGQGCKWVGAATKGNIWRLFETRNRELPRFPAIPLLALIWKKILIPKNMYISIFRAALFTIARSEH